ncbi:MAG: diacylglycerol kinase family protein [Parafilimonas sp.]
MIENNQATIYRQTLNRTFINAFNGIQYFFRTERNGKIQASVAIFVILAGFYVKLSAFEWIITLLCIGAVLSLEMLNTSLEYLCNIVHGEYHPVIKIIKDVAAGAVLAVSIISSVIGLIIFIPKLLLLI